MSDPYPTDPDFPAVSLAKEERKPALPAPPPPERVAPEKLTNRNRLPKRVLGMVALASSATMLTVSQLAEGRTLHEYHRWAGAVLLAADVTLCFHARRKENWKGKLATAPTALVALVVGGLLAWPDASPEGPPPSPPAVQQNGPNYAPNFIITIPNDIGLTCVDTPPQQVQPGESPYSIIRDSQKYDATQMSTFMAHVSGIDGLQLQRGQTIDVNCG